LRVIDVRPINGIAIVKGALMMLSVEACDTSWAHVRGKRTTKEPTTRHYLPHSFRHSITARCATVA